MNIALEINNLVKKIGRKVILNDVSFSIRYGEIVGLMGKNGAGKTSILKCIAGLWNFESGIIRINNKNISKVGWNNNKIAGLIEYPSLYSQMSLKENIDYFKILYLCDNNQRIEELLELLNLKNSLNVKISAFSSGMKQKACLLIALMREPEILLLDEPTAMMDPISSIEIRDFIKKISNDNIAILLSSHNIDELSKLCNRIIEIDNKQVKRIIETTYKKRYIVEFSNKKEFDLVAPKAEEFNGTCRDNKITFGDVVSLKNFFIGTNPNLSDITISNGLEIHI